MYERVLFLDP
uniref:Uncharacterized protein n=1 Tax=Amphimedon queenslandica TaxID=400682 RepID=A0A1X7T3Y6_AMPQE